MSRYARLVAHHPWAVLAALALVTLVALQGVVDLRTGRLRIAVDPAIDRLLPDRDEERLFYDRARELFGGDEFVLLVLECGDVFTPATLATLQRVTRRIEAEPFVGRVVSLANAVDVEGREDEIRIGPFYETPPEDPAELARLRARVLAHPFYGRTLVSPDGQAASVLVFFADDISDRELVEGALSTRLAALAREESGGLPVEVTGTPHVKVELSRTIVGELGFILPGILGVAALMCVIAFRTLRGVVLPLGTILIAVLWTLGAMGWSGSPLSLVSNIVPALIITLGFAAAIHVVSEYYEALHHAPASDHEANRAVVTRVIEEMGLAIAVNGFTTLLGFASLVISPMLAIREFGLWAVVGVVAATVVSLAFVPALLVILGPAPRLPRQPGEGRVDRVAVRLAEFDVRHRRRILVGAFALLVLALAGMARLEVSTGYVTNFMPWAPVRTGYEAINQRLGGVGSLFLVVDADEDGAFTRPENLRVLRELQDWLEAQPEIGGTASLADGVRLLNRAFSGEDPAAFAIPERAPFVRQILAFGGEEVTRGFVDARYRTANITVRSTVSTSAEVGALLSRIEARLAELPQRLRARPTGDLVLLAHTLDDIARGQITSIATAIFTIYLTLAALLTSLRVGLYALLPNLLPIAVYYGALGLSGLPLNVSTSLVGCITLGIAVDDTVHYFARFALEARRLGDERRATATTLRAVIRPVSYTTLGLCLGFLVLAFSDLRNQVEFGILSAFTMAVGWGLELTLSPAICSRIRIVTLWDLLTVDLGQDAQRQIPLFDGLSTRQARIFALMSEVVSVPAGTRLFTEGQPGREMFVVIDGELVASLARGAERVELARMGRGDVVGEIALFSEARSADVDVARDARLLRFDEAHLERLSRRSPRIAARVYRNLNRVIARRVLGTQRALR